MLLRRTPKKEKRVSLKGAVQINRNSYFVYADEGGKTFLNTGERIHIEGHSKVTYTPDSTIRDYVNRPFAEFETIILNDGVDLSAMEYIDTTDNTDDDTSDDFEDEIIENVANVPSIESKEEGDSDRRSVDIGSSEIVEEDKQPVVADDDVNPTVTEDVVYIFIFINFIIFYYFLYLLK